MNQTLLSAESSIDRDADKCAKVCQDNDKSVNEN